jgi:hypothetical protein
MVPRRIKVRAICYGSDAWRGEVGVVQKVWCIHQDMSDDVVKLSTGQAWISSFS